MTRIFVTHRFPALHRYRDAPNEVAFLRDLHRHQFHVRAELDVFHDDRELEFLIVQRRVRDFCADLGFMLGDWSCEQIAMQIAAMLRQTYGGRRVIVEVSEDGENGAIVEVPA